VTNPANGCSSIGVANVMQNIAKPNISVSNTGPLTCSVFDAEIQGSSTTPDVDYSWTGPDGFASSSPTEFVFSPGDYVLTLLDLNNGCSSTDTTTVLQDLSACQRTYAAGAKKASAQSETAEAAKATSASTFTYRAYPNPFSGTATIEFATPQAALVDVSLYNTQGACKAVLFHSTAQAGQQYKLPLDGGNLPAGVYYCIIRINEKSHTLKMIAIKK
jgi:hypothetical protein